VAPLISSCSRRATFQEGVATSVGGRRLAAEEPKPRGTPSPKRLGEDELRAIESALLDLRRTMAAGEFFEAERILRRPSLDASSLSRLIVEVRRLRALVKDAAPYFDGMETEARGQGREREIRQLQVRLRAEVDPG